MFGVEFGPGIFLEPFARGLSRLTLGEVEHATVREQQNHRQWATREAFRPHDLGAPEKASGDFELYPPVFTYEYIRDPVREAVVELLHGYPDFGTGADDRFLKERLSTVRRRQNLYSSGIFVRAWRRVRRSWAQTASK